MSGVADIIANLADATTTANGHFSTLTLSIHEDARSETHWRNSVEEANVRFQSREALRDKRDAAASIGIAELYERLTSSHEHNHFKTHTSSAFGMLLTFAQLLRHQVLRIALHNPTDAALRALRLYDRVIHSMCAFSPEWTQRDAVDTLNAFFSKFEGHETAFTTSLPDAPACPDPRFVYANMLETCAILAEIGITQTELEDRDPGDFLRAHLRDHEIYFSLLEAATHQLALRGPVEIALAIALDAKVPLFGRETALPVDWMDFHPGYRLARLVGETAGAFEGNREFTQDKRAHLLSYHHEHLQGALDIFRQSSVSDLDRRKPWQGGPQSTEGLIARMTARGRNFMEQIDIDAVKPIIDHGFVSHARRQQFADKSFLAAHMTTLIAVDDQEFRRIEFPPHVFALFSVFGDTIGSVYFDEKGPDVVRALCVDMEHALLARFAGGGTVEDMRDYLRSRYKLPGAEDAFHTTIDIVVRGFTP